MQSPFNEEERVAWGGLLSTYGRMDRLIEADLQERHGISHVEFEILLRLYQNSDHRLRLQDLASGSILTRSGTSRAVERLEKQGLLSRSQAEEDRRGAYATLSEKGKLLFQEAMQGHVDLVRKQFLSALTNIELAQLAAIWHRVKAHQQENLRD